MTIVQIGLQNVTQSAGVTWQDLLRTWIGDVWG